MKNILGFIGTLMFILGSLSLFSISILLSKEVEIVLYDKELEDI